MDTTKKSTVSCEGRVGEGVRVYSSRGSGTLNLGSLIRIVIGEEELETAAPTTEDYCLIPISSRMLQIKSWSSDS
ncbi:hypothetical protein NC652_021069 [Populus alba x Populus x berolinensis]|nr:hypothetical protein NC652_021069 [Populus alba x Populus x berolinensis]